MMIKGEGKQVTASDTPAQWTLTSQAASAVSIHNKGSVEAFFLANCTLAEFNTAYAAGAAIPIAAGMNFTFNGLANATSIRSICYRTASSTTAVNFAAF